ncbi:hypothetical protein [Nitrospirillum sp. BR 11828]|uniref:hypothetical protein n=1 Tax=Nitrospirillum sp. BR 11828 TaxID=3104325 RepID=UPI002ACA4496|nr:hypothetical protein [Nitrospirillum sp. BR 11828]MDZ5650299.1 hypothetical protein [Nitrospirillum sp. BR 11828]
MRGNDVHADARGGHPDTAPATLKAAWDGADGSPPAGDGPPAGVIALCNHLILLARGLFAVRFSTLPAWVASQAPALALEYGLWQASLWRSLHDGLITGGLVALARRCRGLTPPLRADLSAASLCALCDVLANQLLLGASYIRQLQALARDLPEADIRAALALKPIAATLRATLAALSPPMDVAMAGGTGALVVTLIDVLAVAGDTPVGSGQGAATLGPAWAVSLPGPAPVPPPPALRAAVRPLIDWWRTADPVTRRAGQLALMIDMLTEMTGPGTAALTAIAAVKDICQGLDVDGPGDEGTDGAPDGGQRPTDLRANLAPRLPVSAWADTLARLEVRLPPPRSSAG